MKRMLVNLLFVAIVTPLLFSGHAHGNDFPTRPLRLIVPFPPGGGADTIGRMVAAKMGETLGQQVVVDNRAGAGGNIAAELTARATPDGYTLLQANVSHAISVSLFRRLGYDLLKDFDSVSELASTPYFLLVTPSLPPTSVKELIAYAKSRPTELRYGSSGSGGSSHLAMELLKSMAGFNAAHIPYKGAAPGMLDLASGQIQLMFNTLGVALAQVKAGKLRGLAVTSSKRFPTAPEVPTIAESIPGYEATTWYGLMVPAGTNRKIVSQLNAATVVALRNATLKDQLTSQSYAVVGSSPAEFSAYVRAEISKWAAIVAYSGAKVE